MADYRIEIDRDEDPKFIGEINQMLRLFLEDLDYEWCGKVLDGMSAVHEAKEPAYNLNTDVINFTYDCNGGHMKIAAKLTRNPSILFTRTELEEALQMMRDSIERARAAK